MTPEERGLMIVDVNDARRQVETGRPVAHMTVRGLLQAIRLLEAEIKRLKGPEF